MGNDYTKPEIRTLSVGEILETLGPVSCGSGSPLGGDASFSPSTPAGSGKNKAFD